MFLNSVFFFLWLKHSEFLVFSFWRMRTLLECHLVNGLFYVEISKFRYWVRLFFSGHSTYFLSTLSTRCLRLTKYIPILFPFAHFVLHVYPVHQTLGFHCLVNGQLERKNILSGRSFWLKFKLDQLTHHVVTRKNLRI